MKSGLRGLALILAVSLLSLGSMCKKKSDPGVGIDRKFSFNLAAPVATWPGDVELTPAQQDVLEEYGEPSYERIWFSPDGEVQRYVHVGDHFRNNTWPLLKRSWIYMDIEREFEFTSRTNYKDYPLTEAIRTLCKYGDPQDIQQYDHNGKEIIRWQYYNRGRIYKFHTDGSMAEPVEILPELKNYEPF